MFNEPDIGYHGLVYVDTPFPPFVLRARLGLLRDLGAALSPFNSWLFIQGLETLSLRVKKHSENALAIAKWLKSHPKVKKVNYSGLKSDPNHKRAKKYLNGYHSGLLTFEVDDLTTAKKIVDNVKIFSVVVNIGDSKSIITHPASTTHQQLTKDELKEANISEGLIRLSIGLEDVDDLIDDLNKALR